MIFRTSGSRARGRDGNFLKMAFLSLIIHLTVLTVLFITLPATSRRLTFGQTYSVQLVGSDALRSSGGTSSLDEFLHPQEAPAAIMIKQKISSIFSTPAKTARDTQRLTIDKPAARQVPKQVSPKAGESSSVSAGNKMSDAEMNAQTNEYIAAVWARIRQNWSMPQALLPETNITAIINVRISRNGALEYADFEKRSGNQYFDESALRALRKANPFPPLPYWVRDSSIEIGIRFHSTELR